MSKFNIQPSFKVKIGFGMSKYDIPPDFEFGNRILNVKLRYSAQFRMPKKDFEWNVNMRYTAPFPMSK